MPKFNVKVVNHASRQVESDYVEFHSGFVLFSNDPKEGQKNSELIFAAPGINIELIERIKEQ